MASVPLRAADLPEGVKLLKRYRDHDHVVQVVRPATTSAAAARRGWWRYLYDPSTPHDPRRGRRYKTLSAIVREITGDATTPGDLWFGLRTR